MGSVSDPTKMSGLVECFFGIHGEGQRRRLLFADRSNEVKDDKVKRASRNCQDGSGFGAGKELGEPFLAQDLHEDVHPLE